MSKENSRVTNNNLRITEKYGITGTTNTYIKPTDQNQLVRLASEELEDTSKRQTFYRFCREVFLPQGYPKSVSEDYFQYQFYDTIQAFASRITGTIATKAILKGVGVGDAEATPLAAAITWVFKDGTGMLASILFAWCKGAQFDSDCKRWRLFADCLNDAAMTLELLLPHVSAAPLPLLCVTTCMKAAVGVAGAATRAAVIQHQARAGNAADVAAKDGSQETAVNLAASIFGVLILALVQDSRFEGTIFMLFTLLHLFANYLAVSSLVFYSLNECRLLIVLKSYFRFDVIPAPGGVNRSEPVVLGYGPGPQEVCGYKVHLGASLRDIIARYTYSEVYEILEMHKNKRYMAAADFKSRTIHVVLLTGDTPDVLLGAYFHAVVLGLALHSISDDEPLEFLQKKTSHGSCLLTRLKTKLTEWNCHNTMECMDAVSRFVDEELSGFVYELQKKDWRTDIHSLQLDDWRLENFEYK